MFRLYFQIFRTLLTKEGQTMMYALLALNILNGKMNFSFIKSKAVQSKVKEQLELLVTDEAELQALLNK